MKSKKRLVAILTAIIILFSTTPVASAQEQKLPSAEQEVIRVQEIAHLRETNSETYLRSDGKYECVVYAEDKYFRNDINQLQLIDNSIVLDAAASTRSTSVYKNAANRFNVSFEADAPQVSVKLGNHSVTFSAYSSSGSDHLTTESMRFSVGAVRSCTALSQLTYTGSNTVTYSDAFPNTDLVYVLDNSALKEYIILNDSHSPNSFSFMYAPEKLRMEVSDSGASLVDAFGNTVFGLSPLFAVDANGAYTEAVSYSFQPVKGTENMIVTVTLDKSFLSASERAYPVIVDPSLMISSVSTPDAFVSSKNATTNYRLSTQLRTGNNTTYGVQKSYIKFDIPASVAPGSVNDAILKIERSGGAVPNLLAYRCTSSWSSSTITWNNRPSNSVIWGSSASEPLTSANAWFSMNVTGIVRDWVNGTYSNYGFVIEDREEDDTSHWTIFYSSDAASPHKPELIITYTSDEVPLSLTAGVTETMVAGYHYRYTHTPAVSDTYSVWTTGSTDTTIKVYRSSISDANLVGSAIGGGHGTNACKTLSLTAGTKYIVVVSGASTVTAGTYTLKFQRGLPMSGSEIYDYSGDFELNSTTTNCYSYALSCILNPFTNAPFLNTNPGGIADVNFRNPEDIGITIEDFDDYVNAILRAVERDCTTWGGSSGDFYPVSANTMVPPGYYKVALFASYTHNNSADDDDYHWMRQVKGANGVWYHKPGGGDVKSTDDQGKKIYVPENATWSTDTLEYTFVGYYALKPPNEDLVMPY